MNFWEKLKAFFTWLFQGNAEARKERSIRKKWEAEIKTHANHEYIKATSAEQTRIATERAKYEADKKIESIKSGGFLGKIAKGLDNASKNLSDNSKGNSKGSKVSKPFKPLDLFPSQTKTKEKPFDIGKIL